MARLSPSNDSSQEVADPQQVESGSREPQGLSSSNADAPVCRSKSVRRSVQLEEPSVVAAASNMAKRCHAKGGFVSNNTEPIMIGQIQVVGCDDAFAAKASILDAKEELIGACNDVDPILVKFGGGCKAVSYTHLTLPTKA